MGVVFSALVLLAVTAWILEKVFRDSEQKEGIDEPKKKEKRKIKIEGKGKEKENIKAIIALALAYHTKKKGQIHIHGINESLWMQQTRGFE